MKSRNINEGRTTMTSQEGGGALVDYNYNFGSWLVTI